MSKLSYTDWSKIGSDAIWVTHDENRKNKEKGGNRPEDVYMVYALDRILDCQFTGRTFAFNKDFDIGAYFRGCCGIIHSDEEPIRVVVKAYDSGADYLRTLPIHETQRELVEFRTDEAAYFEIQVCPTYDLYQSLLLHADQIEVVEPESVRKQMRNFAKNLMSYYKEDRNE